MFSMPVWPYSSQPPSRLSNYTILFLYKHVDNTYKLLIKQQRLRRVKSAHEISNITHTYHVLIFLIIRYFLLLKCSLVHWHSVKCSKYTGFIKACGDSKLTGQLLYLYFLSLFS